MKKWFLVLGFWLAGTFAANAFDPCEVDYKPNSARYKNGIAFIVQKCGGQPNIIIGTMHSDDPLLMQMHKNSLPALAASKNALFEIKFDENALSTTMGYMVFAPNSGRSLKKEIGNELYAKFISKIERPEPMHSMMKPWAAAIILQYPKDIADGVELDLKLQNIAKERKVNVIGLEKVEEQLSIFDNISKADQVTMLRDVLDNYELNLEQQKILKDTYLRKDLIGLEKLIPESLALSSDRAQSEKMLKLLIDDRNVRMTKRMENYLINGNAYVAIGALHLPGKTGVLKLLEDKGFRVGVLY